MHDLADFHHLITDLFAQPKTASDWDQYRISKDQIDFFHENGYLADIKLLDEKQIEVLKKGIPPTNPILQKK